LRIISRHNHRLTHRHQNHALNLSPDDRRLSFDSRERRGAILAELHASGERAARVSHKRRARRQMDVQDDRLFAAASINTGTFFSFASAHTVLIESGSSKARGPEMI